MKKIILASASPRRKELLELIGIPFSVVPSTAEEVIKEGLTPAEIVESLSLMKAQSVSDNLQDGLVIGSDTIVVLDGEILGKPLNEDDAFKTLQKLQGRAHYVFSGVAVIEAETGRKKVSHQVTKVYMCELTDEEIADYIATKEPMDKAGSYGIQGLGAINIEKIEGDFFNVVGLPLALLKTLLNYFDIKIMRDYARTAVK